MKLLTSQASQRCIYLIWICLFVLPFNHQCKKTADNPSAPTLTTTAITEITETTASSGGTIESDGGSAIIEKGICWSGNPSPGLADKVRKSGSGNNSFQNSMDQLLPETVYYVRAFATNPSGTGYGNTLSFTTSSGTVPEVTTAPVSLIKQNGFSSGGSIVTNGGAGLLTAGIYYATHDQPDGTDYSTSDSIMFNEFSSLIIQLIPNTTYYVRAYATNKNGTGFGKVRTLKTPEMDSNFVIDNDYNLYPVIRIGNQLWMGENLRVTSYKNGELLKQISDKEEWLNSRVPSYCWYNNDVTSNKTENGALYNWITVTGENLCPTGWHVPSQNEWILLSITLGEHSGGKLKQTGTVFWLKPNLGATDEFHFTAYPSGIRNIFGEFNFQKAGAYFWSNTKREDGFAWSVTLNYAAADMYRVLSTDHEGFSIRCVKNLLP